MDRVLNCVVAVLLMANLLLQACSLVERHQLRETKPVYFCGNYYLYHNQNADRIQMTEDGVVLDPWNVDAE